MLSNLLHQGQRRRAQDPDAGFTLIEVVVSIVLLGIVMVPLTAAFIQGLRRSGEVSDRLARSADLQRITSFWTRDVGNVDSDGVNSTFPDPDRPGQFITEICNAADPAENGTHVVSLRWDGKVEGATPKIATWALVGEGKDTQLKRRLCEGGALVETATMADAFAVDGLDPLQMVWGTTAQQDDFCPRGSAANDASQRCTLNVGGAYSYTVVAERRVRGAALPGAPPPPEIVDCQAGPGLVVVTWNPSVLSANQLEVEEYQASLYRNAAGSGTPVASAFVDGTSTSASVPAVISTPGEQFWVRVRAKNAFDYGAYSLPCGPVAPDPSAPGRPTNVIGTPADKTASVNWTDPPTGGSPITNYTIFLKDGSTETQFSTSNKPFQLPSGSLVNARPYQFAVQATNLLGTGPKSDFSPVIFPFGPTLAMNQPNFAEIIEGTNTRTGRYRMSWTLILPPSAPICLNPPASGDPRELALKACISNGSPVTSYRVELVGVDQLGVQYPVAGFPATIPQPTVPANPVPNLSAVIADTPVLPVGRTYFGTITPVNAAGDGTPGFVELALAAVAPGPPGLPTIQSNGNSGQLDFVLRPPTDTGGAPISRYEITTTGGRSATVIPTTLGDTSFTWSPSTATGPALADFERYGFSIRACNSAGCGTASPTYNAVPVPRPQVNVSPVTYPSPGNVRLQFAYAPGTGFAPATTGPVRRTTYNATCGTQSTGVVTFASSAPVTATFGPLPIGPITCSIVLKSVGESTILGVSSETEQAAESAEVPAIVQEPPGAVGAPTITATGASGQLAFQIPAPSNLGGATIGEVSYRITTSGGRSATVPAVAGTTSFSWTSVGTGPALVDFTAYDFTIEACNREGCGPATGPLPAMALPTPSVSGLEFAVPAVGTARVTFTYAPGTGTSPAQASPVGSTSYTANCGGPAATGTFQSELPVQSDFLDIPVEGRSCSVILSSTGVSTVAGAASTTTVAGAPATTATFLVAPPPLAPNIIHASATSQQLRFRLVESIPAGVTSIGIARVGGGQPNGGGTVPVATITAATSWTWSNTTATVPLTNFQRQLFRMRSCNASGLCGPWSTEYRGMSAVRPQLQVVSSSSPAPGVARVTFRLVAGTGSVPSSVDPFVDTRWRFSCTGGANPSPSDLTAFESAGDVTADITGLARGLNNCTLTAQNRVESTASGLPNVAPIASSPSTIAVPITIQ